MRETGALTWPRDLWIEFRDHELWAKNDMFIFTKL